MANYQVQQLVGPILQAHDIEADKCSVDLNLSEAYWVHFSKSGVIVASFPVNTVVSILRDDDEEEEGDPE